MSDLESTFKTFLPYCRLKRMIKILLAGFFSDRAHTGQRKNRTVAYIKEFLTANSK